MHERLFSPHPFSFQNTQNSDPDYPERLLGAWKATGTDTAHFEAGKPNSLSGFLPPVNPLKIHGEFCR